MYNYPFYEDMVYWRTIIGHIFSSERHSLLGYNVVYFGEGPSLWRDISLTSS
jgi:hypothetical protein